MATRVIRILLTVLSLIVLLGTVAFLILYWKQIPALVPNNFDGSGEITGMVQKKLLIANPIIMAVIYVSLFFPKTMQLRSLGRSVSVPAPALLFPAMQLILLAGLSYLTVCSALVRPVGVWFMPVFLGATFLPLLISILLAMPQLKQ